MRRLPWTLYRYIAREIYLGFVLSLGALSLLFMVISGIRGVSDNFSLRIIMPWIFESLGYSLYYTVPVSLLFAVTLGYGRLVADKEYTAISSSGISPIHVFVPSAFLALVLSTIAMATQGEVLPRAHYIKRNIARYLVKQLEDLGEGYERELPIDKGRVFCKYYNGSFLQNVRIEKNLERSEFGSGGDGAGPESGMEDKEFPVHLLARQAKVSVDDEANELVLSLNDVRVLFPHPDAERLWASGELAWPDGWDSVSFTDMSVRFPIDEKKRRRPDKSTSVLVQEYDAASVKIREYQGQLQNADAVGRADLETSITAFQVEQRKLSAEIWRRRSLALSCFVFPFVGFPISLSLRHRHRLLAFFLGAALVTVVFYPLLMLGETLAEAGLAPPAVAVLSGNLVLLGIASVLTGRLFYR